METSRKSAVTNMLWRFAERCGAQGVTFIVSLILARLLEPSVYGVVSLITIFTSLMQIFVDTGFSRALIQKKDADQLDFSTMFYFDVVLGILLYALLYVSAPAIARFYQKDFMVPYIRVMSLSVVLGSVNSVQEAIVAKRMIFKKFFYATLIGTVISAVVGVYMAYKGFGVWALIAQKLVNQAFDTLFLWISLKWRPSRAFSFARLKPLFVYGGRVAGSVFLDALTTRLTSLLIGKRYDAAELAYYDKGSHFPSLASETLRTSVQSVLFPLMAKEQGSTRRVKRILRRSVMLAGYCVFPCVTGIALCAPSLIPVLYGEKWIATVPYMQGWCFAYAFVLIDIANLQVLQALGYSDIYLKVQVIRQVLGIIVTLIFIQFSALSVLIARAALTIVFHCIDSSPNKRIINYGFFDQLKDLLPIILLNLIMGGAVFAVGLMSVSIGLKLILQIVVGITVYVFGSWLMNLEVFAYLLEIIKGGLRK